MDTGEITVYGAYWCPDCRRAKKFLGEQRIPYNWVGVEQDKAAEEFVLEKNDGKRIIPTIVFEDGSFLVEPSNAELAQKLGLKSVAKQAYYDLIIVGAGPCGMTAAMYAAREGIDVLLVERSGLGGQAAMTQSIDNFPAFPDGLSGEEFAERMIQQLMRYGVEILKAQEVIEVEEEDGYKVVQLDDRNHYHSKALLIATGARYRRLGVDGEEDFIGAGVHFCATCDGPFYKGAKELVVVGGGNSACEESLHLLRYAEKVTMLVRGDKLNASKTLIEKITNHPDIEIYFKTRVEAFEGEGGKLKHVKIKDLNSGETKTLSPQGLFVFIGQQPCRFYTDGERPGSHRGRARHARYLRDQCSSDFRCRGCTQRQHKTGCKRGRGRRCGRDPDQGLSEESGIACFSQVLPDYFSAASLTAACFMCASTPWKPFKRWKLIASCRFISL
jgi:thioredoxin reductase (NADPH)